jgi:hypothetical protein
MLEMCLGVMVVGLHLLVKTLSLELSCFSCSGSHRTSQLVIGKDMQTIIEVNFRGNAYGSNYGNHGVLNSIRDFTEHFA